MQVCGSNHVIPMPNKQINLRPDANSLTTREINIFTPKYIGIHEKQDERHVIFSNQLFQTRALLELALSVRVREMSASWSQRQELNNGGVQVFAKVRFLSKG